MIFAGVAVGNLAGLQLAHGAGFSNSREVRLLASGAGWVVLLKRLIVGDYITQINTVIVTSILATSLNIHVKPYEYRSLGAGGLIAGCVKETSNKLAKAALQLTYQALPWCLRRLWKPPIHSLKETSNLAAHGIPVNAHGQAWDIITTSRYVSYACLGWSVTGVSFLLFRTLQS